MAVLIAALFGAFVGSFLNVCVHRLPRNESVVKPPSRCYSCGARVRWYDNLPVISYLVLRGRCRWCGTGFSPRYLVMEVLVAALTALVVWAVTANVLAPAAWLGKGWLAQAAAVAALCALMWFLVVSTLTDLEHMIIPDELTKSFQLAAPLLAALTTTNAAFGMNVDAWMMNRDIFGVPTMQTGGFLVRVLGIVAVALGLLLVTLPLARWIYSSFCPAAERWRDDDHRGFRTGVLWFAAVTALGAVVLAGLVAIGTPSTLGAAVGVGQALLGSLAGWWSVYLIGLLGTIAFRRNAMGFGDVKFLAPIGAFLGPVGVIYAFFGAATVGALIGLPMYLLTRRNQVPFGPYLALGSILALLFGPAAHQWILSSIFRVL